MKLWMGVLPIVVGVVAGQGSYTYGGKPDTDDLEVLGACSVVPDEIQCWDAQGHWNTDLTNMVVGRITEHDGDLRLKYKKKNRIVVLRHRKKETSKVVFNGELQTSKGGRLNEVLAMRRVGPGEIVQLYWYYPEEKEDSLELSAVMNSNLEADKLIPLKEGAEAKLGPYSVKVGKIGEGDAKLRMRPGMKVWRVEYQLNNAPASQRPNVFATPVGEDGKRIRAVDADGNPIEEKTVISGPGIPLGPLYQVPGEASTYWICNIRPEKVANLQISGYVQSKVTFKAIALNPKK